MGIAFDAVSTGTITAGNTVTTFNHTVTGSNTIMHLFVTQQNDSLATRIVALSVTYNGVASTAITSFTNVAGDTTYCFEIIAPTTGTNTVSVTRVLTTNTTWINVLSHTGAAQSSQPDASSTANTTTTTLNTAITTVADKCWSLLGVFDSDGGTASASTNSVQRSAATNFAKAFDSNSDITPAGSFTMTTTRAAGSNAFSGVIVSIAPFVTPTTTSAATSTLTFMHAG